MSSTRGGYSSKARRTPSAPTRTSSSASSAYDAGAQATKDWVPGILLTAAFLALVATSLSQIATTCRQWRHLARRYAVSSRRLPERRTRFWRAYVGSLFHPFQHLQLAWDEQAIFFIPSPLTQRLGFGPLCLPWEEINARPVRHWWSDWVELRPKDTSCAVLLISQRAWRKSGLPLP